jgi:hypothetical protein
MDPEATALSQPADETEHFASDTVGVEPTFEDFATFLRAAAPRLAGKDIYSRVLWMRKKVSVPSNPPLNEFVAAGLVPLVTELTLSPSDDIATESLWALTNIASGDAQNVAALLAARSHLRMITCLASANAAIVEQAVWALGNIAGDGPVPRDVLLNAATDTGESLVQALVNLYQRSLSSATWTAAKCITFRKNILWTLSNCCRGKPQPSIASLTPLFPFLCEVLRSEQDNDSVLDALWCVSYISDGPNDRVQLVLDHDLLAASIRRLRVKPPFTNTNPLTRPHEYVQESALPQGPLGFVLRFLPPRALRVAAFVNKDILFDVFGSDEELFSQAQDSLTSRGDVRNCVVRTIGNVVTGNDSQTEKALKLGVTDILSQMACSTEREQIRKEINWTLSNITAGTCEQVECVTNDVKLVSFLRSSLRDPSMKVAKEAMWTVANAMDRGSISSMDVLARAGVLHAFVGRLWEVDKPVARASLDGILGLCGIVEKASDRSNPLDVKSALEAGLKNKHLLKCTPSSPTDGAATVLYSFIVPYLARTSSSHGNGVERELDAVFGAVTQNDDDDDLKEMIASIKAQGEDEDGSESFEDSEGSHDNGEESEVCDTHDM